MKKNISIVLILVLALGGIQLAQAQQAATPVTAKDLNENIDNYLNKLVTLEAVVDRHEDDRNLDIDVVSYVIQGEFGNTFPVRTNDAKPEVNNKYRITGTIAEGPTTNNRRTFYLREMRRSSVDVISDEKIYNISINSSPSGADVFSDGILLGVTPLIDKQGPGTYTYKISKPFYEDKTIQANITSSNRAMNVELERNLVFYLLFTLGGLILIVAFIWGFNSISSSNSLRNKVSSSAQKSNSSSGKTSSTADQPKTEKYNPVDNPTVKFYQPVDKTIKILPGKFKIMSGISGIDMIRLYDDGKTGRQYSFGRKLGNEYSHFQLKSPTVSRNQATLIVSSDEEYLLINKAGKESNPTIYNGEKMGKNDRVSLNPDDIIQMGEVKLQFVKD